MKKRRKYNLLSCAILSTIGAFFGALAVSGLIFPFTVFVLSLLPQGNLGIPTEVFQVLCRGILLAIPLVLAIVWLVRARSPARLRGQMKQRARLDALLEEEPNSDAPDG